METQSIKYVLVTAIVAIISATISAQDNRPTSYVGIDIEAGASHLFLGNPFKPFDAYTTPSWGGGGGGGIFYELEYKHFMIHTGFGVNYTYNQMILPLEDYSVGILEYPSMHYKYSFNQYLEKNTYGIGYIPIKLGASFDRWYFLVGAKLGVFSFAGTSKPQADVTIWAQDEDIIDPMYGLHTHHMGEYCYIGEKRSIDFASFNAMLSAEIGINLNKRAWLNEKEKKKYDRAQRYRNLRKKKSLKELTTFRLALFADYGMTNIHRYQPNPVPYGGEDMGGIVAFDGLTELRPYSMLGYKTHKDSPLNNLLVGIKLSAQVEIPKKAPKKGALATPYIYIYVEDEVTEKPLANARVKVQRKGYKYVYNKLTDAKRGRVARATAPGEYTIHIAHGNYCPIDTIHFTHRDDYDTLYVALYPYHTYRWPVVDAMNGRSLPAQVQLNQMDDNIVHQITTDSTNHVAVRLDNRKEYILYAESDGYIPYCDTLLTLPDTSYVISLVPNVVKTFILKNMYFATAQTTILPSSQSALDMLYELLNENSDLHIRIVGHTDDVGSDASNMILSNGRSESIRNAMIKMGIDGKRITTDGKGEREPIVPNDSDDHRQMNRRVEIEIISGADDINIQRLIK